jgi:nucleoside-diphosphate-sugar epimerase
MRILITGIHGFVGSNLIASYRGQHTIYGLDIVSPHKEGVVATFAWDRFDSIPPVDVIIHLAGKAHDTRKQTNAELYFEINTGLTQKVYNWFLKSEAKTFIFFSSVKAAAEIVEECLTEDVIPKPIGPYGESKLAAENYISEKMSESKRVYILRPSMIHGPDNKGNLNLLYKLVSKGIPWPLGVFKNGRSFTSIGNIQYIVSRLMEGEIESGIYNVADDEALSTNYLIQLIAESNGRKTKIWMVNKKMIYFLSRIGDFLMLPLNSERLKKLTESYIVSNSKLKKALGIERMPISTEEGMKNTLSSL